MTTHSTGHRPLPPILVALVLGIGAAINPINSSLVVTSFADIAQEFGISFADVSVMMTYYLAFTAAFYPIAGAVGDRLGRKRVYLFGIAGFGVVSLVASWAPNFYVLLCCRCLQALFSAALMPNASALLREMVPEQKLAGAIGIMSAIVGTATALGFPLGGLLSQSLGWRPLFWVNVPLALFAMALAWYVLPAGRSHRGRFSLAAFFGVPLLPLALGINFMLAPEKFNVALAHGLLVLSGAVVAVLLLQLYRSHALRQDVASFSNRGFGAALAIAACYSVVLYATMLVLPTWLAFGLGVDKRTAGLFLGLITLSLALGAPWAGRFIDRYGERPCIVLSGLMMAAGLGLFWSLDHPSMPVLVMASMLMGFSFTGIGNASQSTALKWVPEQVTAMAMGLYTCGRYLGGLVGTSSVAYLLGMDPQVDLVAGRMIFEMMMLGAVVPLLFIGAMLPVLPSPGQRIADQSV